jgi:hypothetical protein
MPRLPVRLIYFSRGRLMKGMEAGTEIEIETEGESGYWAVRQICQVLPTHFPEYPLLS